MDQFALSRNFNKAWLRLFFSVTAATLFATAIAAVATIAVQTERMWNGVQQELEDISESLAKDIGRLETWDNEVIRTKLRPIAEDERINHVSVVKALGSGSIELTGMHYSETPLLFQKLLSLKTPEIATANVYFQGQYAGYIELAACVNGIASYIWKSMGSWRDTAHGFIAAFLIIQILVMLWVVTRHTNALRVVFQVAWNAIGGCSCNKNNLVAPQEFKPLTEAIDKLEHEMLRQHRHAVLNEQRLKLGMDLTGAWYWEQDENFCFTYVSDGVSALGITPEELIGKPQFTYPLNVADEQWESYRRCIEARGSFSIEHAVSFGEYGERWYTILGEPIFEDDIFLGYRGVGLDVTAVRKNKEHLDFASSKDPLTQLTNAPALRIELNRTIQEAKHRNSLIAVCCIDLDGFKKINDTHGHGVGDKLLLGVAERIKECVRTKNDLAARIGGDEFVVVMTEIESRRACQIAVERLLRTISRAYQLQDFGDVEVSASIGVTLFNIDDSDADGLLRHADQAMLAAKQEGRNRIYFFDTEHDRAAGERSEILKQVKAALANDEFLFHYQPKVDMTTGEVVGVEALLRWDSRTRGLIQPSEFLGLIEGSSLSVELGYWGIRKALQQIAEWSGMGIALQISVNVSAQVLLHEEFFERLRGLLEEFPEADPKRLGIEILECVAIKNITLAQSIITKCKALGISFSIDDFGTGYSSLTYLKRLKIDCVKIDQSFIRSMLADKDDFKIIEGVINISESMRYHVIAEGVESEEHGAMLLRLGCRYAQGFGIAKPMPAERFVEWLRTWEQPEAWVGLERWPREHIWALELSIQLRQWVNGVLRHATIDNADPVSDGEFLFSCIESKEAARHFGDNLQKIKILFEKIVEDKNLLDASKNNERTAMNAKEIIQLTKTTNKAIELLLTPPQHPKLQLLVA